jgi:hypothetical protein
MSCTVVYSNLMDNNSNWDFADTDTDGDTDPLQGPDARTDVHGAVMHDLRADFLNDLGLAPWDR